MLTPPPSLHQLTYARTHGRTDKTPPFLLIYHARTTNKTTHPGPDHPAAKAASILSQSPFPLDAPHAYCTNSADVLHPLW